MSRTTWGMCRAIAVGAGFLMALLPPLTYGLGLGPIKVKSALNENLSAEIEFTAATDRELRDLQIGLAPVNAFQVAGIERHPRLSAIQFEVKRRVNGRPYLHLTTKSPYPEPFLHILLQAEWSEGGSVGRLRREYTALIDPPFLTATRPGGIRAPRPAPAKAEPEPELTLEETTLAVKAGESELLIEEEPAPKKIVAREEPELLIEEESAPKKAPPVITRTEPMDELLLEPGPPADGKMTLSETRLSPGKKELLGPPDHLLPGGAPGWASTNRYRVKRGDTAYGIARRIRQDKSVSLEQVVLALYDNNSKAFFENNTNNLRSGKILKIPDRDFVTRRSRRNAGREFRAQYDSWQEYKLKQASARQPVSLGEPPAAAKTRAGPAKTETKPKVREKKKIARKPVEKAKPPVVAKPQRKGMQIPPSRSGRKGELLRIVRANLDKKSKSAGQSAEAETAKGKQKLAEKAVTLEGSKNGKAKPKAGTEAGKPQATPTPEKRLMQIKNADLAQPAKPGVQAKAKTEAKPETKPAVKKPIRVAKERRKPVKRIPPPARKEESFVDMAMGIVDEILGNQLILIIAGALVVLGGGIGLIYVRRRKKSLSEFEESILTSGDISTGEFSTGSEDVAGNSGDTSFLSDFSQGGMGNIATDEVDPVAEADVYLAYGRDEQAEEILKDAIVKHPARHELKEKLLELYSQRSDVGAFETLAEELYAALEGKGGKLWDRIAAMGSALNPGNPMFQGGAPVPAMGGGGALEMTAPAAMEPVTPMAEKTQAIDIGQMQQEAMAPEIDMGMGGGGTSKETEVVSDDALDGLEFDLDISNGDVADLTPESAATEAPSLEMEPSDDTGGVINFEPGAVSAAEPEEEIAFDAGEISLETDAGEGSLSMEGEDEFAIGTDKGEPGLDMADLAVDDGGGLGLSIGEEVAGDLDVAVAPEVEEIGAGGEDQWDEAATKLDLAKAYVDMGDSEGARSILEEVAVEGNEDQKRQAADLASQIA